MQKTLCQTFAWNFHAAFQEYRCGKLTFRVLRISGNLENLELYWDFILWSGNLGKPGIPLGTLGFFVLVLSRWFTHSSSVIVCVCVEINALHRHIFEWCYSYTVLCLKSLLNKLISALILLCKLDKHW